MTMDVETHLALSLDPPAPLIVLVLAGRPIRSALPRTRVGEPRAGDVVSRVRR